MSIRWRVAEHDDDKYDAYVLRSKGYRRYYRNIPSGVYMDELDVALLPDGSPRARTLLITEDNLPVGTGRASLIHSPRFPMMESEIEFLFEIPNGLLNCIQAELGYDASTVTLGELSRFTALHETKTREVLQQVFEGALAMSYYFSIDLYLATMNNLIARRFHDIGAKFTKLSGAKMRRDNPDALWYFVRYFEYFLPRLGDVLPEVTEANYVETTQRSYEEMREIIDALYPQDPVYLRWIRPQAIYEDIMLANGAGEVVQSA